MIILCESGLSTLSSGPSQAYGKFLPHLQISFHRTNRKHNVFFNWAIPGLFYSIFVFSGLADLKILLSMSGFEPRISGVGSDRSANCATTTVHRKHNVRWQLFTQISHFCLLNLEILGNQTDVINIRDLSAIYKL